MNVVEAVFVIRKKVRDNPDLVTGVMAAARRAGFDSIEAWGRESPDIVIMLAEELVSIDEQASEGGLLR